MVFACLSEFLERQILAQIASATGKKKNFFFSLLLRTFVAPRRERTSTHEEAKHTRITFTFFTDSNFCELTDDNGLASNGLPAERIEGALHEVLDVVRGLEHRRLLAKPGSAWLLPAERSRRYGRHRRILNLESWRVLMLWISVDFSGGIRLARMMFTWSMGILGLLFSHVLDYCRFAVPKRANLEFWNRMEWSVVVFDCKGDRQ